MHCLIQIKERGATSFSKDHAAQSRIHRGSQDALFPVLVRWSTQHLHLTLADVSNGYRAGVRYFSTENKKYMMENSIQGSKNVDPWPLSRERTHKLFRLSSGLWIVAWANLSPVGFVPYIRVHIAKNKPVALRGDSSLRGENIENWSWNNIQPVPQYVLNNFSSDLIKKTVEHFLESNQRSAANESNISSAIWLQVLNTWCSKAFFLHWNAIKGSNILIKSLIQSTVPSSHVTALQSI